jgi:hypothetical protein
MSPMMVWAINILLLSIIFLIVGMIKPKWLLFWMDKPGRIPIILLSSVLFMIGAVMFGEANLAKQQEAAKLKPEISKTTEDSAPAVVSETAK